MTRIKLLGVRFSAGEFVRIVSAADALGMTPTAWVRHQALRAIDGAPALPARFHPPADTNPPAKLTRTAGTRFSEEQFVALTVHARACGLTVTTFIRKLVLGVKPIARMPPTRSAIVAVNRVGTNLNQLVKLANSGVVLAPELVRVILEVQAETQVMAKRLLLADRGEDRKAAD